jgi:3-deoxy-D-manno-octulosonic acid (KDO) 8-phosphate synthase
MDELDDRVAEICTRIGMLMEDGSVDAVTITSLEPAERAAVVDRLGTGISEMANLLRQVRGLIA